MADLGSLENLQADIAEKVTTNAPLKENTGLRVRTSLANMADTLWAHANSVAFAGVSVGNCLFVNSTTGDDATGVRGRMDKMYETIDGALAASGLTAGDTIVILDNGSYAITSPIVLDTNIYAPNAILTGSPVKLAADNVSLKICCSNFNNGVISEDMSATPTTGTRFTLYGSCYSDIEASYVFVYDGYLDGDIYVPDGGAVSAERYYIANGITGLDGSLVELRSSFVLGDISLGDGGGATIFGSQVHRIFASSGAIGITTRGSLFELPPDPATVGITNYGAFGLSPLLTASFNAILTDTDPGAGEWGVDADNFDDITYLRVNLSDYNGNDITDYLDGLSAGQLEMRTLDYSKRMLFDVSSVTTATGYRKINVTPVLGAFPEDGEFYTFDFREAGSASTPQTLADTLIEGQTTSGRSIIISEFDGINFEQGANQVRLKAPATATDARTQTLQDADGVIALVSDFNVGAFTMFIEAGADKDYTLDAYAVFGYTINSLAIKTGSGTCNATVKINGTAVAGISAIGVTSSVGVSTASGANTVTAGQRVIVTLDTTAAATDIELTMKYTRS